MTARRPLMRYHGSKWRLAPWLFRYFPPHEHYTEAFGGSAAVLLQKPRPPGSEVYNDLDGAVVGFFRVLRDPTTRARLEQALRDTPFARAEFEQAWEQTSDPIESARRLAVRAQMGFGSAGAVKGTTGFRADVERNAAADWARYPDALSALASRIAGVTIENLPALELLERYDRPDVLHYIDPPYVQSTRVMRSKGGYRHEMTDIDHIDLLDLVRRLKGMVIVSGYDNPIYREWLADWRTASTRVRISAGRGTGMRTETIWINAACELALARRLDLFNNEVEAAT